LRFNFAPATIFLGDTGSLFLGFFLAALAVRTSQKSPTLLAIVVPFVAFGLPLLDTLLSLVRRFLSRRPLFVADRDHIHHRLLKSRITPRVAVLGLYALAALFSLGSLVIIHSTGSLFALVAVLTGALGWFVSSRLRYEELVGLNVYVSRAMQSQRQVVANEILIRKASRQLEASPALEESWRALVEAIEALDFDGVACELSAWPVGSVPILPPWSRSGEEDSNDCWSVSIPLRAEHKALGILQVWRALKKDRLLFQFSSLLDTLIPPFENQLKRCYDGEDASRTVAQGARPSSPLRSDLLADERKG
jgi:UDP-GlcNAc:undecaprenyl-phosphate GlcNAc-1-phosphate transferase